MEALSERERDALRLIVSGLTYVEAANLLFLESTTVKTHMARAYKKLGVASRAEARVKVLTNPTLMAELRLLSEEENSGWSVFRFPTPHGLGFIAYPL